MVNNKNKSTILILLLVLITLTSACSDQKAGGDIIDIQWEWSELFESEPASQSVVPNPENYTIIFYSDGSMNIKADCNIVGGTFSVDGTSLTLDLGPSTLAYCGEESLDLMFNELLSSVESYTLENDQLVLILENDSGKLSFNK